MKDRFRFRLYDKEKGLMLYEDSDILRTEKVYEYEELWWANVAFPIKAISRFFDYNSEERFVLQQCTGLKDNNGKLIYEYDVVRFGQEDEDIGIVMWNEDECKFVISEEFNKSLSDFSNWYGEDLEILGNIFEHNFFGKDTTAWLKASNIL